MTVPPSPQAIGADQAAAIFSNFAATEDLALGFLADGCYARTHVMVQHLLDQGLSPMKVWAFAASAADPLWVEAPNSSGERVEWSYHVAPVLVVREPDCEPEERVFDPVLFDRPVRVEEWLSALHDAPRPVRTVLGEPPLPAVGGSGYWPSPDPPEGPDVHARETLEEYGQYNS
jgi:hypothetical protein